MVLTLDGLLTKCLACGGTGCLSTEGVGWCELCSKVVPMPGEDAERLSCGHPVHRFQEERPCLQCGGTGQAPTAAGTELLRFVQWALNAGRLHPERR